MVTCVTVYDGNARRWEFPEDDASLMEHEQCVGDSALLLNDEQVAGALPESKKCKTSGTRGSFAKIPLDADAMSSASRSQIGSSKRGSSKDGDRTVMIMMMMISATSCVVCAKQGAAEQDVDGVTGLCVRSPGT